MKIIKPDVIDISQTKYDLESIYKQIELSARTCYKSEDKIGEGTAEPFVKMLIDRGHTAMLEHGIVILRVPKDAPYRLIDTLIDNKYTFWIEISSSAYSILTNYRVIVEYGLQDMIGDYIDETMNGHAYAPSFRIICDNGVARELTRHRTFSFAQESSRYCNYSKDKFQNELTFIRPWWMTGNKDSKAEERFIELCLDAEANYFDLLKDGLPAQAARAAIPLCGKTEIVMTGYRKYWNHFLGLRTGVGAHPDMKIVANMIKDKLKQNERKG